MASISLRTKAGAAAILLGLLALTLGIKLLAYRHDGQMDEARLVRDLTARFEAHGYRTAVVARRFQSHIVVAGRGACLVAARNGDLGPMFDDEFRLNSAPIGPLRYVHGGQGSERPPRMAATFGRSLQAMLGRIGVATSREPVIAEAARPGCATPSDFYSGLHIHLAR